MQIMLQAYYSDIYYLLTELQKKYIHYCIECETLDTMTKAIGNYMRYTEFDNRYDSEFVSMSKEISRYTVEVGTLFGKDSYTVNNLAKRIVYMIDTNAKSLAFSCNTVNEYNQRISLTFKGLKKADYTFHK